MLTDEQLIKAAKKGTNYSGGDSWGDKDNI